MPEAENQCRRERLPPQARFQKCWSGSHSLTTQSVDVRRNENIVCYVRFMGESRAKTWRKGLKVKDYEKRKYNFARNGLFGLGIAERGDSGTKYDPNIFTDGMDFCMHFSRPGLRMQYCKLLCGKAGSAHRWRRGDCAKWF